MHQENAVVPTWRHAMMKQLMLSQSFTNFYPTHFGSLLQGFIYTNMMPLQSESAKCMSKYTY